MGCRASRYAQTVPYETRLLRQPATSPPTFPQHSTAHWVPSMSSPQRLRNSAAKQAVPPVPRHGRIQCRAEGRLKEIHEQIYQPSTRDKKSALHEAKLPPALEAFTPINQDEAVAPTLQALREVEAAVTREPSDAAVHALQKVLAGCTTAYRAAIHARVRSADIVPICKAVEREGSTSFEKIYFNVFSIISSSDPDGCDSYVTAIAQMRTLQSTAGATQQTGDISQIYADAAAVRPHFSLLVSRLASRREATLSLPTTLKSSSRMCLAVRGGGVRCVRCSRLGDLRLNAVAKAEGRRRRSKSILV